jgi:hypothetical protein
MPEFDDRLDHRLRAALGNLGDAAQRQVRPDGVEAVPAAGRRRRRAALAARSALALVLAGGLATGWWLVRDAVPADPVAAPGCVPAEGLAFLPAGTTDELRTQVGVVLQRSPGVTDPVYETKEEAYRRFRELYKDPTDLGTTAPTQMPESWSFTLRCAGDYPAVKKRLEALPGVEVVCSCDPRGMQQPAVPGDVTSGGPPGGPTPSR